MTILPMAPMPMPAAPTVANPDGTGVPVDAEGSFAALFATVLGQSEVPAATPQPTESMTEADSEIATQTAEMTDAVEATLVGTIVPEAAPVAEDLVDDEPPADLPAEVALTTPTATLPVTPLPVVAPLTTSSTESGLDELDHPEATSATSGVDQLDHPEATSATSGLDKLDHPAGPTPAPVGSGLDGLDHPVAPATPAATATATAPTAQTTEAAPVSHPVLDQVKPSFTKLVSGPEGMHRMTLRLHPADLGEIHLTVRVQGDTVEVTVAASPEARAVLADNQGELRGLLDAVGRTAGQITFRDLPGPSPVAAPTFAANPDGQSQASHQQQGPDHGAAGQRDGNGHNAGQPADQSASSPQDGRPGVPAEPRPTTTTTSTTRSAGLGRGGLDVRM